MLMFEPTVCCCSRKGLLAVSDDTWGACKWLFCVMITLSFHSLIWLRPFCRDGVRASDARELRLDVELHLDPGPFDFACEWQMSCKRLIETALANDLPVVVTFRCFQLTILPIIWSPDVKFQLVDDVLPFPVARLCLTARFAYPEQPL